MKKGVEVHIFRIVLISQLHVVSKKLPNQIKMVQKEEFEGVFNHLIDIIQFEVYL